MRLVLCQEGNEFLIREGGEFGTVLARFTDVRSAIEFMREWRM